MSDLISELKLATESQHGGAATLAQSVSVRETFEGRPVWERAWFTFLP